VYAECRDVNDAIDESGERAATAAKLNR